MLRKVGLKRTRRTTVFAAVTPSTPSPPPTGVTPRNPAHHQQLARNHGLLGTLAPVRPTKHDELMDEANSNLGLAGIEKVMNNAIQRDKKTQRAAKKTTPPAADLRYFGVDATDDTLNDRACRTAIAQQHMPLSERVKSVVPDTSVVDPLARELAHFILDCDVSVREEFAALSSVDRIGALIAPGMHTALLSDICARLQASAADASEAADVTKWKSHAESLQRKVTDLTSAMMDDHGAASEIVEELYRGLQEEVGPTSNSTPRRRKP